MSFIQNKFKKYLYVRNTQSYFILFFSLTLITLLWKHICLSQPLKNAYHFGLFKLILSKSYIFHMQNPCHISTNGTKLQINVMLIKKINFCYMLRALLSSHRILQTSYVTGISTCMLKSVYLPLYTFPRNP